MIARATPHPPCSRVLVLEDEPRLADIVSTLLQSEGYDVDVRPRDEVLVLPDPNPGCLIVFDEEVAGMDGTTFVREMREAGVRAPAMLFTTSPWLRAPADMDIMVVEMPFDLDEVIALVGECCGQPA